MREIPRGPQALRLGSHELAWRLCGIQGKYDICSLLSSPRRWPEQVSPGAGSGPGASQEAPGGGVCPGMQRGWLLYPGEAWAQSLWPGAERRCQVREGRPEPRLSGKQLRLFDTLCATFWCLRSPSWTLHAAACQLAVGAEKVCASPSQETGIAWSPSSLLALSIFLFCQMEADYFFLSLPVSMGNPGIPFTIYCHRSLLPLCLPPKSLNEAGTPWSTRCTVVLGVRGVCVYVSVWCLRACTRVQALMCPCAHRF